jgi:glycine/D-amino acid oxidase-like deaminating enzyme
VRRIAVVGAGLGGALLAWRLTAYPGLQVEVFAGDPGTTTSAATTASGGLVRAYDPNASRCLAAAASLAELRGSPALRRRAGYQEAGSLHLLMPGADPAERVGVIDELLPGSAEVLDRTDLARRYPFRDLERGVVGVAERHAGWFSPARLCTRTLEGIARAGVTVHRCTVRAVDPGPTVRRADGSEIASDIVVLAAGSYTPALLARSGLPNTTLRTKQVQYTVHDVDLGHLGAFVDDNSGLYGRPAGPGRFLLGLPSGRWDVDPSVPRRDDHLAAAVVRCAGRRLGVRMIGAGQTVTSTDCYHDLAGLALRDASAGSSIYTFTGGSGGAAKSALAASRAAAAVLTSM